MSGLTAQLTLELPGLNIDLLITLVSSIALAAATNNSRTILVLDGSGSMWGHLDGVAKITIARDVIGNMVQQWDTNNNLGLVVYGHRVENVCNDIQSIIPVGSLDAEQFKQELIKINPEGMTPLSAAVKQAAELLDWQKESATIILVSDGRETCDLDPCAVAQELSRGVIWRALSGEKKITQTGAAQPTFTLPAGSYTIEARTRNPISVGQIAITLVPGEQQRAVVELVPADVQ